MAYKLMKAGKMIFFAAMLLFITKVNSQEKFKKLDTWLADHAETMGGRDILLIYKEGKIIYSHAEDKMTMRQQILLNYVARKKGETADLSSYKPDSRQPIASCSKWLSAALVMTFVDEGKLKLTDTVGKYLPVLTAHGRGNITISDCLSHRTGIDEPKINKQIKDIRAMTGMDDAIALLAAMPMDGEPGKVFHYSNAGLQIAAAVIEKISGKDFKTLFHERIAVPLNMLNTDYGKNKVPIAAGSAISTPNDYINFLTMIMNRGMFNGKRILSEKSIDEMQVNRLTADVKTVYSPAQIAGFGYGYGEWVLGEGYISSPGLFGSYPWVDNVHHYCAFLMTYYINNEGRDHRMLELKALVDEAIK